MKNKTGWLVGDIFDYIESGFSGDLAMLIADCCYSGTLCLEAKSRSSSRVSWLALPSAESGGSNGNWTFTDAVPTALSGSSQVDLDRDFIVELSEMAEYVKVEMNFVDGQKASLYSTGRWSAETGFTKTSPTKHPAIGRRALIEIEGKWRKAKVIDTRRKDNKWKVVFVDTRDQPTAWVSENQVKSWSSIEPYEVGKKILVLWRGKWYPATVIRKDKDSGLYKIHYDGFRDSWDEWVGHTRTMLPE